MTDAEAETFLDHATAQLGEHFDAVQILASLNDAGGSICYKRGAGNWYARQGMAHEFINADIAQGAARQIAEHIHQQPEDDEPLNE